MNERKDRFFFFCFFVFFWGGGCGGELLGDIIFVFCHNRPWKTYFYWFTCSEVNYYPIWGLVGLKHANESNELHNDVMNCDAF